MSAGTPAAATACITRRDPPTLTAWVCARSRDGWINQPRCTTAPAPARIGSSGSATTSSERQVVFAEAQRSGGRRATATTSSTPGSASSARSSAEPALPDAPRTTTFIGGRSRWLVGVFLAGELERSVAHGLEVAILDGHG